MTRSTHWAAATKARAPAALSILVSFAMRCKACSPLSSGVACPFKLCPSRVEGSKTLFFSVDIAFAPFLSDDMSCVQHYTEYAAQPGRSACTEGCVMELIFSPKHEH